MDKCVTVLGAGSSGMTTAAYLGMEGWDVTLCDTPEQSGDFEVIRRQNGIILRGGSGKTGCQMPWKLTNNFKEALSGVKRVIICVSAGRHEEVARLVAPLAEEGQSFLLSPGNFGSFYFKKELEAEGKKGVKVAELSGNLWACRRTAPGEVLSSNPLKKSLKVAALPSMDTEAVIEDFSDVLPLTAAANIIEASLNSPNVVSHVSGAVLNATDIERKGKDYAFFMDGLGEAVLTCFGNLENALKAVMDKLGLGVYNPPSEGHMRRLMDQEHYPELDYFRRLDGPSSFRHRYVSEDAACGVAMLVSLGQQYQVPTPVTQSFLTIAGAINGVDYLHEGRTLENLGLSGLTIQELMEQL